MRVSVSVRACARAGVFLHPVITGVAVL